MVVIDIVVDVARTLEDQVAVETACDMVLLKEGSSSVANVYSIAKCSRNLIEEDMRMGVAINLNANFLVEPD